MKAKKAFHGTVVTQLVPFRAFFPAEAYHQDYATNHPADAYTQAYIVPKIWKLKLK
jgi:peptide-methionine (S)-S-oxide reductase